MKTVKISTLKKGDFFRKIGGKQTLVYDGKVRVFGERKWAFSWFKEEDINDFKEVRKDIHVVTGFEF